MEFKLPEIGEGVHEGELIRWLVRDGETVQADQALLEVMTDKATVEVPSPCAGVIRGLTAKDGQMIKVGQILAVIEEAAGAAKASAPASVPAQAPAPVLSAAPAPTPAAPASGFSSIAPPSQGASFSPSLTAEYRSATESLSASSVPAAPVVRAMAAKMGVDLSSVAGTGPQVGGRNRVLEQDLLQFLAQSSTPSLPSPSLSAPPLVERRPVRGLRRVIAQAMVKSKFTAPHYSYVDEFECSELVALREQAKVLGEKQGVKITYLPFIVKALVGALKEFPECNSSLEEGPNGMELVIKRNYHIGFAVASKEGLLVPVIKNADQKSLVEIAREMTVLSDKVRAGKASSDELKGSTFSITSMGNIGGLFATPIINYPEVGILGVYKVQEKPVVKSGQIVVGKTMHLSLSLDHRVIDGAVGGAFCNAIIERLANPARLLMELV
jgi:pyruvate dehydrogenase E2 component (dihydrolipoamide acetyltransferase)